MLVSESTGALSLMSWMPMLEWMTFELLAASRTNTRTSRVVMLGSSAVLTYRASCSRAANTGKDTLPFATA